MQGIIASIEFLCFAALVGSRVVMLRRRGVKAFVFGATDKTDFILVPCVLLVVYAILANAFSWPLPFAGVLSHPFWHSAVIAWLGVALCGAAIVWLAVTLRDFGTSFRVGIDEAKPDKLVTTGVFSISRNPIYVAFFAFFVGLFLVFPNLLFLVVVLLFAATLHRQVLREERFLKEHYGDEYAEYCQKVRRYL